MEVHERTHFCAAGYCFKLSSRNPVSAALRRCKVLADPSHDLLRFAKVDLGILFRDRSGAVAKDNSSNIEPELLAKPSRGVVPKLVDASEELWPYRMP
jgi:hypothetical protein